MLISEEYRAQQQRLHEAGGYGTASIKYAPLVSEVVNRLEITHLLDYGCGSMCNLGKHLKVRHKLTYQAYDPGVPKFAGDPVPAQMVACIDVLEHIEPELIDNVLDHLQSLTEAVGLFTVHTGPASKVLADGRNAHLIQQPIEWWLPKFTSRWDLHTAQVTGDYAFYVICYAKAGAIEAVSGEKLAS